MSKWIEKHLRITEISGLISRAAGVTVVIAVFVGLAGWSWRKWADAVVDFGHELYVPWRLNSGEVLGRDIMILYGPFSKYFNALLFRLFGVSLTTLIFANLAITLALTLLLFAVIARVCDALTATVSCILFLCLCAFAHYGGIGNFNFICPYSQEAVHGLVLSVVMIVLLWSSTDGKLAKPVLAGLCLGAVALTKTEITVAAIAALASHLALVAMDPNRDRKMVWRRAAVIAGSALIAPLLFLAVLAWQEGFSTSARTVAAAWTALVVSKMSSNIFWIQGMGLDHPWSNIRQAAARSTQVLPLIAAGAVADYLLAGKGRNTTAAAVITAVLVFLLLQVFSGSIPWLDLMRLLPGLAAAAAIFAGTAIYYFTHKGRLPPDLGRDLRLLLVWSVFSLVMLGRMVLNARLYDFGFYLAAPAVILTAVALLHVLPRALRSRYGGAPVFRGAALAVLASLTLFCLSLSNDWYSMKDYAVGRGGDLFWFYGPDRIKIGETVNQALEYIQTQTEPDATLLCLPSGVMLNYLARRDNPTPYLSFLIGELQTFGEQNILQSFKNNPPDYILLIHQPAEAFGFPPFGQDPRYGRDIMIWVEFNYREVWARGADPARSNRFGIKIMASQ